MSRSKLHRTDRRNAACRGGKARRKGQRNVQYEVYVDVLFANCLIMNYWIVSVTGILLRRSATRRRRAASAALGACLTVLCLLMPGLPETVCLALGYGVVQPLVLFGAFRIKPSEELLLGCACMYFLTFLYGGWFSFLQERAAWPGENGLIMPVAAGAGAVAFELVRAVSAGIRKRARLRCVSESRRYEVRFLAGEQRIRCIGLLDTGNRLYEPIRGIPVAVLEEALFPPKERGMPRAVIPYHSLGCRNGILYGYTAREVSLRPIGEKEEKPVYLEEMLIGLYAGQLSAGNEYQILLHPDFFLTESKIGA